LFRFGEGEGEEGEEEEEEEEKESIYLCFENEVSCRLVCSDELFVDRRMPISGGPGKEGSSACSHFDRFAKRWIRGFAEGEGGGGRGGGGEGVHLPAL